VDIIEIRRGIPIPELPNYSVCKRETVYTIYHVVGVKVGCTCNFDRRRVQNQERYGSDTVIEILDIVSESCGPDFAGDVEWAWADWFGYQGQTITPNGGTPLLLKRSYPSTENAEVECRGKE
jgi:hypothetical protein